MSSWSHIRLLFLYFMQTTKICHMALRRTILIYFSSWTDMEKMESVTFCSSSSCMRQHCIHLFRCSVRRCPGTRCVWVYTVETQGAWRKYVRSRYKCVKNMLLPTKGIKQNNMKIICRKKCRKTMLTYKEAAPVQQTLFVWVTEKNYNREKEKNLQHGCTISEKKHSGLGLVDDLHLLLVAANFYLSQWT